MNAFRIGILLAQYMTQKPSRMAIKDNNNHKHRLLTLYLDYINARLPILIDAKDRRRGQIL